MHNDNRLRPELSIPQYPSVSFYVLTKFTTPDEEQRRDFADKIVSVLKEKDRHFGGQHLFSNADPEHIGYTGIPVEVAEEGRAVLQTLLNTSREICSGIDVVLNGERKETISLSPQNA